MKFFAFKAAFAGVVVWMALWGGIHAAWGRSHDEWTDYKGIKWFLEADFVTGELYDDPTNRPTNVSVIFDGGWGHMFDGPGIYFNMTLTKFTYTKPGISRDIVIPNPLLWDSGGSDGVKEATLQIIASSAFKNTDITSVQFPDSIMEFEVPCFLGCTHLTSIAGAAAPPFGKENYITRDGVLYTGRYYGNPYYDDILQGVLKYPEGKEGRYLDLPETVTNLVEGCLANTKLRAVRFRGAKPECDAKAFTGSRFVGYCPEEWGLEWGEQWNGIFWYPIPADGVSEIDGKTYHYSVEDGVLWRYVEEDGEVWLEEVVDGGRYGAAMPDEWPGAVDIPAELDGKPVTRIGADAFFFCNQLTGVTIPDSVTNVSNQAFGREIHDTNTVPGVALVDGWVMDGQEASGWVDLSGVRGLADGDLFAGNTNLVGVALPEHLWKIDDELFRWCSRLEAVTGGEGVKRIGNDAFAGCSALEDFELPSGLEEVGERAFAGTKLRQLAVPDSVTNAGIGAFDCPWAETVTVGDGLTDLGAFRFAENTNLASVTLGRGVGEIGDWDFQGCTALAAMDVPDTVTRIGDSAFDACTGLRSVRIGAGVAEIGNQAFQGCTGLETVSFAGCPESIAWDAFWDCSGLERVEIADLAWWCGRSSPAETGNPLFYAGHLFLDGVEVTDLTVPAGVGRIGDFAFMHCSGLTNAVIPDEVEEIGDYAFSGCSNLVALAIGAGATNFMNGTCVFDECAGLEEIRVAEGNSAYASEGGVLFDKDRTTLLWCPAGKDGVYTVPAGTGKVADFAFKNCSGLTGIALPDGLKTIGRNAFDGCAGLRWVTIPDSVASSGLASAFYGCEALETIAVGAENGLYSSADGVLFDKAGTTLGLCPSGKEGDYVVPDGVVRMSAGAFWKCAKLTSVTVPQGVTAIAKNAFFGCAGLRRVELPEGLVGVSAGAFEGCGALKALILPRNVKSVGSGAFESSGLRWVVVPDALAAKTGNWGLPEGCEVIPWGEWATRRTSGGVPYEWLWENGGREAAETGNWEAAAALPAANARTLGECWVAGLDPADPAAEFKAELVFADGEWQVKPSGGEKEGRLYRVEGKQTVSDNEEWSDVEDAGWRFFRMRVELAE